MAYSLGKPDDAAGITLADTIYNAQLINIDTTLPIGLKQVKVLMGLNGVKIIVNKLADLAKQINIGSSHSRVAYGSFLLAAEEIKDNGTFPLPEMLWPMQRLISCLPEK